MLLAGGILLAVSILAVAGVLLARRGAGETTDEPTWNTIAAVDRATGVVTFLDAEGEEQDELETNVEAVNYVPRRRATGWRSSGTEQQPWSMSRPAPSRPRGPDGDRAQRIPTSRPLVLVAAPSPGGDATIVLASTSLDVGELAGLADPLVFAASVQSDPDGTRFAVDDARSQQTVVVGPGGTAPRSSPASRSGSPTTSPSRWSRTGHVRASASPTSAASAGQPGGRADAGRGHGG